MASKNRENLDEQMNRSGNDTPTARSRMSNQARADQITQLRQQQSYMEQRPGEGSGSSSNNSTSGDRIAHYNEQWGVTVRDPRDEGFPVHPSEILSPQKFDEQIVKQWEKRESEIRRLGTLRSKQQRSSRAQTMSEKDSDRLEALFKEREQQGSEGYNQYLEAKEQIKQRKARG